MKQKLAAARVEHRPATGLALEQRTRELLLEVLDVAADRGLRDAELAGRGRETPGFRNGYKDLEPTQGGIEHAPTYSLNPIGRQSRSGACQSRRRAV